MKISQYKGIDPTIVSAVTHRARSMVGVSGFSENDLDDLCQELMLHLFLKLESFDSSKGSKKAFVEIVVKNYAIDLIKHSKNRNIHSRKHEQNGFDTVSGRFNSKTDEKTICIQPTEVNSKQQVELQRKISEVEQNLSFLKPKFKKICEKIIAGCSFEDLAEEEKMPVSTFYSKFIKKLQLFFAKFVDIGRRKNKKGCDDIGPLFGGENKQLSKKEFFTMNQSLATYSMMRLFGECKAAFKFRYMEGLVPLYEKSESLHFGSLIHDCLEMWHGGISLSTIKRHVKKELIVPEYKKLRFQALAMMQGYVSRYPDEKFKVIALEKTFSSPILNPETGLASRKFEVAGKIDGVVEQDGKLYILEHKTASSISGSYISKIPNDFQVHMYSLYAKKLYNRPIEGVIYNVLQKSKLSPYKKGYRGRKEIESDSEFLGRLYRQYENPDMFHREVIPITKKALHRTAINIWQVTQDIVSSLSADSFYQNFNSCHKWFRPCSYYSICHAGKGGNLVKENFFEYAKPHSELDQGLVEKYSPISLAKKVEKKERRKNNIKKALMEKASLQSNLF